MIVTMEQMKKIVPLILVGKCYKYVHGAFGSNVNGGNKRLTLIISSEYKETAWRIFRVTDGLRLFNGILFFLLFHNTENSICKCTFYTSRLHNTVTVINYNTKIYITNKVCLRAKWLIRPELFPVSVA